MKQILIFGAGSQGSWYGWRLSEAGASVTLFSRSDRVETIQNRGIPLKIIATGEQKCWKPESVLSDSRGNYDLILVFVRAHQIEESLKELKHFSGDPTVVFMGNSVSGHLEAVKVLGKHRVITGMGGVGGYRDGETIMVGDRIMDSERDSSFNQLVLGAPYREAVPRLSALVDQFKLLGYKPSVFHPVTDWHLCHAGIVLILAGLLNQNNFDREKTLKRRKSLNSGIKAFKEFIHKLQLENHHILPDSLSQINWLPHSLLRKRLKKTLNSPFTLATLVSYSNGNREELKYLAKDIDRYLFKDSPPPREWKKLMDSL